MKLDLNQITISVEDVEKSILFYELLGLKLIVKSLPKYARFECTDGDATFSLHQSAEGGTDKTWLYFETDTLDEDVKVLTSKGIHFEHEPVDQSWLWREARLKDPDGNQIILYRADENRKNPPWRI
ncbi:VOC family protein [Sphingobacterium sp. lm-10]|uniref:VOC family protein n=1 Tax=Sphingobacterium sp. lm-10 TaxID=2944904 RepID=UPI00201FDCD8|nr:VOC family protein [Sphingobacterium sp. lm-10]MCL7987268.1 VOC family protein [Sphingobacterium sp. lm-10]